MKKYLYAFTCLLTMALPVQADDWMARLDDGAYITQLSIPGAHDAATGNGFTADWTDFGEAFARTQDLPLAEQWAAGVRAFDLRPTVSEGRLLIHHGIIATTLGFAEALGLLRDSLEAHPTEFAIVVIRHEDDAEDNAAKAQWPLLMKEVVTDETLAPVLKPFTRSMTVADMRGHILLLSRNTYQGAKGGIISGWSHSATTSDQRQATITQVAGSTKAMLYCQDFYDCSASGAVATKTATIRTMLDFSTRQHKTSSNAFTWIINHTSGYSLTSWGISSSDGYRDNAARQNSAVIDYLADEAHWGPTGIIVMDFAGVDRSGDYDVMGRSLIQAIIENNFRYTPKANPRMGIATPQASPLPAMQNRLYDLSGRPLSGRGGLQKGVYVRGGKLYLN